MNILWTLIVGLVVGVLAKLVMPGRDPGGIFITALLGIAGSFVAAYLGNALHLYSRHEAAPGLIASVLGAVILLGLYRVIARRRVI